MSEGGVLGHVEYNKRQLCNIANLKKLRKKRGLRIADVVRATGIAESSLYYYENGRFLPFPENYNKLAQLFGWKQITVITEDLKTVEVEDSEVKPKTLSPVKLRPDFIVGHIYSIKARKTGDSSEKTLTELVVMSGFPSAMRVNREYIICSAKFTGTGHGHMQTISLLAR